MPISSNPTIQLVITAATYGGRSIARYNGKAVFVPFALPGEVVKAQIVEDHKNHAVARLVSVEKSSPLRIAAPCPMFGKCGGCHYQHIAYEHQLTLKQQIFAENLERIAKIKEPPCLPIIPSPIQTGYRNNMQFHLNEAGGLCFFPEDQLADLLPIKHCLLASAEINNLLADLVFEEPAGIDRVSIRVGQQDMMLVLEAEDLEIPNLAIEADISVVHLAGDDMVVLSGQDAIRLDILEKTFRVSAPSFFQVNTLAAELMVKKVLALVQWNKSQVVMDLYCGAGLFSAFIAPLVSKVIGIEVGPSSCADFEVNLDAFDNVELYEGMAEDILPYLKQKVDVVIVDPPRAGLDKKVIEAIAKRMPSQVIYVSCDPTTLARDLQRFAELGYGLVSSQPLDMFPQTFHIESISLLEKQATTR